MKQPKQLREGQQTTKHHRTRDNQIKEGQVPQKWTKLKRRQKTAHITFIHYKQEIKHKKLTNIYTRILYIYTHTSAILIDHWNVQGEPKYQLY